MWCRKRLADRTIDFGLAAAAALGAANVVMYLPFGVADDGRYLLLTLFCGGITAVGLLQGHLMDDEGLNDGR